MPFPQDRDQLRQFYCDVWHRHRAGGALTPLERQIFDVILLHPEYQPLLERPDAALGRDYLPELGENNPFLHMGLHLALHEQIATDRPAGIRALAQRLRLARPDGHDLEHRMMDCLAKAIWHGQRDNIPPDDGKYIQCLKRLLQQ